MRKRRRMTSKKHQFLSLLMYTTFCSPFFSNVEVYISNQQIYNSNGLYVHKSCISNNFTGAISEYKVSFDCEGYDYEGFPDKIMEALLSEPFFTRRMKMLSRPDGFMLYGKLRLTFSPILNCYIRK